jgi:hypothetical protein
VRHARISAGIAIVLVVLAIGWQITRVEVTDPPLLAPLPPTVAPPAPPATVLPQSTPRPVTVTAQWRAAAGIDAEDFSEGRFAPADLRFGERLYIERVCVSDARKLTMVSYRDAVGHTDVPLPLGARGAGRVDPSDRNCTLFDGVEVARLEKCKCWFQCAGEEHRCTVAGTARR